MYKICGRCCICVLAVGLCVLHRRPSDILGTRTLTHHTHIILYIHIAAVAAAAAAASHTHSLIAGVRSSAAQRKWIAKQPRRQRRRPIRLYSTRVREDERELARRIKHTQSNSKIQNHNSRKSVCLKPRAVFFSTAAADLIPVSRQMQLGRFRAEKFRLFF
jgi:hypothetical protein